MHVPLAPPPGVMVRSRSDPYPNCERPMTRYSGQVETFGKVWPSRGASTDCAPCGVGELTAGGKVQLARAIEATHDVFWSGDADPKPRLEELLGPRVRDGPIPAETHLQRPGVRVMAALPGGRARGKSCETADGGPPGAHLRLTVPASRRPKASALAEISLRGPPPCGCGPGWVLPAEVLRCRCGRRWIRLPDPRGRGYQWARSKSGDRRARDPLASVREDAW